MVSNFITTFLIILVFGLGMASVASEGPANAFVGPGSDLHHQLGLSVFILVLIQAIFGIIAHNFNVGHWTRKIHMPFGIIIVALLYWQTWEGMHNEWAETSVIMTTTTKCVQVLFWVFSMGAVIAYVLGVVKAMLSLSRNGSVSDPGGVEKNRMDENHREA
jgi:cytochrome b561